MDTLQSRRSIRKYSSKDVSNHLLYQLLERAERTQTMGNLQLYSVVITRDAEQKKLLSPAHFHQPMVMQAPVVLTFCPTLTELRNGLITDKQIRAITIFFRL